MPIPIGLQLYSVREDVSKDLSHVLREAARMGYEGVEFYGDYDTSAGGYAGQSVQEIRKQLDDLGIVCCGSHVPLHRLLGDELPKSVEFHRTLGNTRLIVPGLGKEYTDSLESWKRTADIFNGIAERLKDVPMQTGYHNHHTEFIPDPATGVLPWDVFFGNTAGAVIMQFDTGNARHGGAEARPFIEKYSGRARSVHLKEYSATNDTALLGEGDVPFSEIFEVCESIGGTQWYVVEQESYAYPPLECAERCLQNLRAMGK